MAGGIDFLAGFGIDGLDALVGEHLVELLQRRFDAGAEIASSLPDRARGGGRCGPV